MKVVLIQHVYTVEGTDREISDYKNDLYQTYDKIDVIPTPFDKRLVCTVEPKVEL